MLKTDDDSLVRVDRLAEELDVVPSERLYWGYRMDNMPVISDPRHRNAEGKGFPLKTYPPYMSGAGYILSRDVVMALAHAHLPYITMTNEDAALGTRLWGLVVSFPFQVQRVRDESQIPSNHTPPPPTRPKLRHCV